LTPTSITSVTPRPALPSCHALPSSFLSLSPTPMSKPTSFCFYVWLLGAYSHFRSEGSLSGGLLFRLCFLFASVFGGLDQPLFATQMVLPFLF
jgi:hypothetical protein